MALRHLQILDLLCARLKRRSMTSDPHRQLILELAVAHGERRVDLAYLGKSLEAFEIKSAHDRLDRLESQTYMYSKIFSHVNVVCTPSHISAVKRMVPDAVGIVEVDERRACLRQVRRPRKVTSRDPELMARLLWRDEALELLRVQVKRSGLSKMTRDELYRELAGSVSEAELEAAIIYRLKTRLSWREQAPRNQL